jgi:glycolate oxidase
MGRRTFLRELRRIVGASEVLDRPEDRHCYATDATGIYGLPDLVVRPGSAAEVLAVLRVAAAEGAAVTPRGAGTGYSGGAVPVGGGWVVTTERMNRIESLNRADGMAVVEAGVVNGDLQSAAEAQGLFYPPDPASLEFSTLGGNIAECAGGPRALKYGVTRDYVMGLEFVTAAGAMVRCGALSGEEGSAYDLAGLMSASEGTLGVITRSALRLIPRPPAYRTILLSFATRAAAAEAVVSLTSAKVLPAVVELIDESSLRAVRSAGVSDLPFGAERGLAGHLLLVEVDGEPGEVAETARRVERAGARAGCSRSWVASDEKEREDIWAMRRAISPALAKLAPTKVNEDVCVPRSRMTGIVETIESLSKHYGLLIPIFGHAGDGNLHVNFMVDRLNADEMTRVERAVEALLRATLDVGGTLSGEHGIGLTKAPFLEWEIGAVGRRTMERVKAALDPAGILNPGKGAPAPAPSGA